MEVVVMEVEVEVEVEVVVMEMELIHLEDMVVQKHIHVHLLRKKVEERHLNVKEELKDAMTIHLCIVKV